MGQKLFPCLQVLTGTFLFCEIRINKDFCVRQPATAATAAAGLLTQAIEGCKLYGITSDLDGYAEDLRKRGKKGITTEAFLGLEVRVTLFTYFERWLSRISNES